MNLDRKLERLFEAARHAPRPAAPALSPNLEPRVLASWKAWRSRTELGIPLIVLLRRGLLAAATLTLAVVAWSTSQAPASSPLDDLAEPPALALAYSH